MTNNSPLSSKLLNQFEEDLKDPITNETIQSWVNRIQQCFGRTPTVLEFRTYWCHIQLLDPLQIGSIDIQTFLDNNSSCFKWGQWIMFESSDEALMLFLQDSENCIIYKSLKEHNAGLQQQNETTEILPRNDRKIRW